MLENVSLKELGVNLEGRGGLYDLLKCVNQKSIWGLSSTLMAAVGLMGALKNSSCTGGLSLMRRGLPYVTYKSNNSLNGGSSMVTVLPGMPLHDDLKCGLTNLNFGRGAPPARLVPAPATLSSLLPMHPELGGRGHLLPRVQWPPTMSGAMMVPRVTSLCGPAK